MCSLMNEEVASDGSSPPPIRAEDLMDIGTVSRLFKQCDDTMDIVLKLLNECRAEFVESRPDGSSILHSFAMFGCYDIVMLLWEKGARPTILQSDNSTLLHSAVCSTDDTQDEERSKILRFFLSAAEPLNNCMPLNHQNSNGWTALKLAARKGLEKCVEVLIGKEADPDIPDNEEYTALHNAVGNPDILKMLATKSRKIDAANKERETPLYLAAERGLLESSLVLLEYGADPNLANKEGIVPLFLAARGGHLELVRGLLKNGAAVNFQGGQQHIAPLHWAAHKEREDVALLLISRGADILLNDRENRTPLSMAAPTLASRMMRAAVKANPSLCLPPTTSVTPCMSAHEKAVAACCSGNVPALQVLHQSGVCINHQCKQSGSSFLHMAAYCGQLQVVMYLISRGADWRHRDKDGDTALHFACLKELPQGQHEKTLEYLLTTPLSQLKDAQNVSGETPLNTACKCKFVKRVKLLLQFKADPGLANQKGERPIHRACISDINVEALLYLVELCPDINVPDGDGWTPLMFAAKSGSSAIVKYLVQRGANPNLTQSEGFSALYLASQEGNVCVSQVLLEAAADPNLTGGSQTLSPLHIAAHRGNKKVCMLLVHYGGDIHQEDSDGDTPLDLTESAEVKQAMLLAHSVRMNQMRIQPSVATANATPTSCSSFPAQQLTNQNPAEELTNQNPSEELTNQNPSEELTNQNPSEELTNQNPSEELTNQNPSEELTNQNTTCGWPEEEERGEAPGSPCSSSSPEQRETPDNECGTGERGMGERENGNGRGGKMFNRHSSKEGLKIGERGHEDVSGELGVRPGQFNSKYAMEKFSSLLKKMESYRQRLAEVEEEMRQLCVDKELLMCRNRSLTAELHSREAVKTGGGGGGGGGGEGTAGSWLISCSSEYEITGSQMNTSVMRFFNVYHGTYRDIPVIVKKVLCLDEWGSELYSLFQEEAVKISQLQCPYVVQLLGAEISHSGKVCALLIEKMMRGCLHFVLHVDQPRMEWGQRLRIVRDICSGMAFIHSHNMLHRNLLPRNILVGEHFNAKISDFGFFELKKKCNFYSKLRAQSSEPQVYMAPEAMEKDEFTAAADVYSFGMVMWEIATGEVPFEEDKKQRSPVLLVMRLLLGLRPQFSPHHDQVYQKIAKSCWHSDPNLRPTFSTLLPELRKLRE